MMTQEEIKKLAEVLYEKLNGMSVLELHQVTQSFAKATGIEAAPTAPSLAPGCITVDEKTEFDVLLKDIGKNKIGVIKEVKTFNNLGLKDAKVLVEKAPVNVAEGLEKPEAMKLIEALEKVGATVELK
jgi:large subunit ribosomal protein L7/L12